VFPHRKRASKDRGTFIFTRRLNTTQNAQGATKDSLAGIDFAASTKKKKREKGKRTDKEGRRMEKTSGKKFQTTNKRSITAKDRD